MHPNWKERSKTVIIADDMILYIESPKVTKKKKKQLKLIEKKAK